MQCPDVHLQRIPQMIDIITESKQDKGTGEINKETCIHIFQSVLIGKNQVDFNGQRSYKPMNGTANENKSFQ